MIRKNKEFFETFFMRSFASIAIFIIFIIFLVLFFKSKSILFSKNFFHLIFSSSWMPLKGDFGLFTFIVGTIEVTFIALLIAIPICIFTSFYLSDYAPFRFREIVRPFIDLLAGIPSVIYGFWAVLVIVPFVRHLGNFFGYSTTGYCILSAGIVLSIMVFPIIISICTEVMCAVPLELRESALALGATRWETVKYVVFKGSLQGIIAAIILGFARAFGETIAVLMVVGNVAKIPSNIFDSGYTLPSLIANNYGEMMSIPLYDSALLFAALILLIVVAGFNLAAHLILLKLERRYN